MKHIFTAISLHISINAICQSSVKNTTLLANCTSCSGTYSWNTTSPLDPEIMLSSSAFSKDLQTTNYGFNIPAGATILGIEARIQYNTSFTSPTGLIDTLVSLLKGGVVSGISKHNLTPVYHASVVTQVLLGSSTDLWGTTWTPADINASNFGFNFKLFCIQPNSGLKIWQGLILTVHYSTSTGKIESQTNSNDKGKVIVHNKQLQLSGFESLNGYELDVIDMTGKNMIHVNPSETLSVDLSKLSKGIYFYRIRNHSESRVQKFLVD